MRVKVRDVREGIGAGRWEAGGAGGTPHLMEAGLLPRPRLQSDHALALTPSEPEQRNTVTGPLRMESHSPEHRQLGRLRGLPDLFNQKNGKGQEM